MDNQIVKLMTEKNEEGLRLLDQMYGKLVRYIVSSILINRTADVEECVNDVYMKIWTHAPSYDTQKSSLKTFLATIARNTALSRLKSLQLHESHVMLEDNNDFLSSYIDYKNNGEDRVVAKEDIRLLRSIIDALDPLDRELILRRYFLIQSSEIIANAMNLTIPTVNTKLHRLRSKMKKEFLKDKTNYERKVLLWMNIFY